MVPVWYVMFNARELQKIPYQTIPDHTVHRGNCNTTVHYRNPLCTSKMSKQTKETSEEQMCQLMNSNYAACVHALALNHIRSSNSKSDKSKVSFAKMDKINIDKCTLTFVECESESMCMMKSAEIPFNPPLVSSAYN